MARSIHSNRSRTMLLDRGYRDWDEIVRKREIKRSVRECRNARSRHDSRPVSSAAIPIVERDRHPRLVFPASRQDIRRILDRLPPGTIDGVARIVLEAGTLYVNAHAAHGTADPFLNRTGFELTPGVWVPAILGRYDLDSHTIALFGFVMAPDARVSADRALDLRFRMLRTLVHEIAHHHDRTRRVARGRWRMDDEDTCERYASIMTRRWCLSVVVPYLRQFDRTMPD